MIPTSSRDTGGPGPSAQGASWLQAGRLRDASAARLSSAQVPPTTLAHTARLAGRGAEADSAACHDPNAHAKPWSQMMPSLASLQQRQRGPCPTCPSLGARRRRAHAARRGQTSRVSGAPTSCRPRLLDFLHGFADACSVHRRSTSVCACAEAAPLPSPSFSWQQTFVLCSYYNNYNVEQPRYYCKARCSKPLGHVLCSHVASFWTHASNARPWLPVPSTALPACVLMMAMLLAAASCWSCDGACSGSSSATSTTSYLLGQRDARILESKARCRLASGTGQLEAL
jgi:hypothetical protein